MYKHLLITTLILSCAQFSILLAQTNKENEGTIIVKEILSKMSQESERIPPVVESDSVPIARAVLKNGVPYLLYNPKFLKQSNPQTKWVLYGVFAHEIRHLTSINRHNLAEKDARKRKENELDADTYSGRVLARFYAPRDQATQSLNSINWKKENPEFYPDYNQRSKAILTGFDDEQRKIKQEDVGTPVKIDNNKFNPWDKLANPPTEFTVYEDRIVIQINVSNIGIFERYKVCLIHDNPNILPQSVEGTGVFTRDKLPQKVIWYYRRDNISKDNAVKSLSIYVYNAYDMPQSPRVGAKALKWGCFIGGSGLLIMGGIKTANALNLYNPYKATTNPNTFLTQNNGQTRTERYTSANSVWRDARYMLAGGVVLGTIGTVMCIRQQKRKDANKLICYPVTPKRLEWSPIIAASSEGVGLGMNLRF